MRSILIMSILILGFVSCEPDCNCADSYWVLKNDSTITVKPGIKQIEFFDDSGSAPAILKISRAEKTIVIEIDTTRGDK